MTAAIVFVVLAFAAQEVLAQASAVGDGRGPFDLALLMTYGWVIALSMLGGFAAWFKKVRDGHARPFNLAELVGELLISGFAGVITFFFCRWASVNEWMAAALIGVAGHMGSRMIFLGEQLLERWFSKFNPSNQSNPERPTQ